MAFEIELDGAGKRFNRDWIFRGLSLTLHSHSAYVVLGSNGSGKSTALRCMLGYAPLSEGKAQYKLNNELMPPSKAYKHMSFCSPYLELYEELTVQEMLRFHFSMKPTLPDIHPESIGDLVLLKDALHRPVKHLSSGMKQRLRLGLALYSDTEVVFLDEPTSNLDKGGIQWYRNLIESVKRERLLIVASNNQEDEFFFCNQKIQIEAFKP